MKDRINSEWRDDAQGKKCSNMCKIILFTVFVFFSCLSVDTHVIAQDVPLRISIGGEPTSLDPHRRKAIRDQFVAYRLFDTLTKYSKDMRIVPSLIESWNNPDDLTWIITIKKNAVFHNGDPLTTRDIMFTLDRIKTKYAGYAGLFSVIESYSPIDDFTFKIQTFNHIAHSLSLTTFLSSLKSISRRWAKTSLPVTRLAAAHIHMPPAIQRKSD